jgi:hypothetical protein
MKTKAVAIGQLRIGSIVREPIGQTLYHRVKGVKRAGVSIHIEVDGGRALKVSEDAFLYVLEDEPAPIVLDGMKLE